MSQIYKSISLEVIGNYSIMGNMRGDKVNLAY